MKLKEGFILHCVGNENMAVPSGEAGKNLNCIVRNNQTAAYLFELLQNDISEEEIVLAMCGRYDADEERIRKDVHKFLDEMRERQFLCGE